jgi:hypothetical protein
MTTRKPYAGTNQDPNLSYVSNGLSALRFQLLMN